MINNNNIEFTSTTTSPFNEGMPFLQDETSHFYQQDNGDSDNQQQLQQSGKALQQGDDFRPTFYNPFEIKHRRRTSRAQFKVLEKTFLENPKPNAAIRRWLAQKLVMTPRGVQVWFQNRRAKEKTVNSKKSNNNTTTTVNNKEDIIANSSCSESTLSLSPANDMLVLNSEPLIKQSSNASYDDMFIKQSPMSMISSLSSPSICACNDCHSTTTPAFIHSTPMTRTMSYPPFYHSSDASNADEEELLMTPVTPFVDTQLQQQQQCLYDYPIFMNNNKKTFNQHHPHHHNQQDWIGQWPLNEHKSDFSYFDHQQQQQQHTMRRMYSDNSNNNNNNNSMMFDDSRRYSHPMINTNNPALAAAAAAAAVAFEEDRFFQSNEVFRRLSEPIFDHHHSQDLNTFNYNNQQPIFDNTQFDLLPRSTTRYSM